MRHHCHHFSLCGSLLESLISQNERAKISKRFSDRLGLAFEHRRHQEIIAQRVQLQRHGRTQNVSPKKYVARLNIVTCHVKHAGVRGVDGIQCRTSPLTADCAATQRRHSCTTILTGKRIRSFISCCRANFSNDANFNWIVAHNLLSLPL